MPHDFQPLQSWLAGLQTWQEKEQDAAIERAERVAAATSEEDRELSIFLNSLGQIVWEFKRMGSMEDLDDAIWEMKVTTATFTPSCGFAVCLKNLRNTFTKMLGRKEKPEFEDAKEEK
jgi:hypothetical protein